VCEVDVGTHMEDLLSQLYEDYPRYTEDLKRATLLKVGKSLSAGHLVPSFDHNHYHRQLTSRWRM